MIGTGARGCRLLVTSVVAGLTVTAGASPASAQPEVDAAPGVSIDRRVLAELADRGSTDFFVYLREQADLSPAAAIQGKEAKGRFVYEALTSTADASQAALRAELTATGVEFTPFWIANVVLVHGDRALLNAVAGRPEVARIDAHDSWAIPAPSVGTNDNRINAIEWGVQNINADDVWSQFGVTGEGIVVANIDTGVDFDHPALVNHYRGNTGTGFDHDYNFFDPTNVCAGVAPCDNNNHGSHTMGTMVGDDGGANQIGVAPGAEWIAAKGCASNSCADAHLLASGQWMVAPTDVNNANPDPAMAPDIVNNSWGGGRGDTWYQATINAWVAAGIFPMFSAGNAGPGCNTANSPGDNIPAYAVGAYDINNNIASFSSRGASGVSAAEIKPNLAAPGVAVRSSINGGGYGSFNGTSMASPHASGVVALLWSAAPSLRGNVAATRTLLDDTARDVSSTGCGGTLDDNNNFGEGRIDALAAVTAAADPPEPPVVVFADDFETPRGWVTNPAGTDTATSGTWAVANPDPTTNGGVTLQLGTTVSGVNDLVTGAAAGASAGAADVDGGDTSVQSPAIALPSGASLALGFSWYLAHLNNASSADYLRVSVVTGTGTTQVFQQLGAASNRAGAWSQASVNLSSFAGQTIRIEVEAADAATASLVEAGVDNVSITAAG